MTRPMAAAHVEALAVIAAGDAAVNALASASLLCCPVRGELGTGAASFLWFVYVNSRTSVLGGVPALATLDPQLEQFSAAWLSTSFLINTFTTTDATGFRVSGAGSQVPTSGAAADTASMLTCARSADGVWIEATGPFP